MKAKEFRGLVEQLGELSAVQREALVAALSTKGSSNEIITLIETRFAAEPCCGHCQSDRIGTWGRANGLRRYKCKECGRTFNALTGTPHPYPYPYPLIVRFGRATSGLPAPRQLDLRPDRPVTRPARVEPPQSCAPARCDLGSHRYRKSHAPAQGQRPGIGVGTHPACYVTKHIG